MTKQNMPAETPITVTLRLDEWFAILAILAGKTLSAEGCAIRNRAAEDLRRQFTEWGES